MTMLNILKGRANWFLGLTTLRRCSRNWMEKSRVHFYLSKKLRSQDVLHAPRDNCYLLDTGICSVQEPCVFDIQSKNLNMSPTWNKVFPLLLPGSLRLATRTYGRAAPFPVKSA